MKKTKKGLIITFLLLIALLIIPLTSVYSASEKLKLETSKDTAIYGDEITVTLNFEKEENNLYAYTAKLSYDKDVFEEISKDDFQENEQWQDVTYNSSSNKFGLINKEGNESQNIIEVKLRVKDNAKRGKTQISISNATASNGEQDISLGSASKELTIKEDELDDVSNIENTTPQEEVKEEQTKTVEHKTNWPVIIDAIIAVVVLIFLIYVFSKNSKIPKDKRTIVAAIAIVLLAILLIVGILLSRRTVADVNTDSKVDYEDSKEVMEYLLETENPETSSETENAENVENQSAMDVNQDGRITTTDVAQAVKTVKKKNNIDANIKSASVNGGTTSKRKPTNNGTSSTNPNTGNPSNPSNPGNPSNPQEQNPPVENPSQNPPVTDPTIMPTATTPVVPPTAVATASVEPMPSEEPSAEPSEEPSEEPSQIPSEEPSMEASMEPTPSVEITSKETSVQVQNGEDIELVLDIELSSDTGVKQVLIKDENGKETAYDAELEEDGKYHVKLPNPYSGENKKYGKTIYEVTGVVLDNGNKVKLSEENEFTITVDILKQNPTLDSFVYNEAGPSITLTIEDRDNAIISGGFIYIYDETNSHVIASAKVENFETEGTKKKLTIDIKDFEVLEGQNLQNGKYNFQLNIPYKPSEEEEGILFLTSENKTQGSEGPFDTKGINIITDYKFDFRDLKIAPKAEDPTLENITPSTATLQFTSTNEAVNTANVAVTVSKVKVKIETQNGESIEREATATLKEGTQDQYEIEVEHNGEIKQTISIESVELSNGKTYVKQSNENPENAEKTDKLENQKVTIFLNKPVAQSFTLNLGDENTNITTSKNYKYN